MRISLFTIGFLLFAVGIVLSLPSLIINAANSQIKTEREAVSFIAGNIIKDFSIQNIQPSSILQNSLPTILVALGALIMLVALALKFI